MTAVVAALALTATAQAHQGARDHCPGARAGLAHYRHVFTTARTAMGERGAPTFVRYGCVATKRRAAEWRARARAAVGELERWKRSQWAAPPEPFLSIARCEQPSAAGLHGVNWQAYSDSYEGGYGFAHTTWDAYKPAGYPDGAHQATIYQQTEVARILVRAFGGYSSWPACHIRLGLPG